MITARKGKKGRTLTEVFASKGNGIAVHCAHSAMESPDKLTPNPRNPKLHSPEQIALYVKIIKSAGWRRCIVASRQSGMIVTGHGAWMAANEMGCKQVPVDWQNFPSKDAEQAAMLADNWLAECMAEYDQDLSVELLGDLRESGFDTELAGVLSKAVEEDEEKRLKAVSVPPVPATTWVLIGIPTTRFGTINSIIEKLSRMEGVRLEIAASSDGKKD